MNNLKEDIQKFEQHGLGPLYHDLSEGNIDSKEFVERLEKFEKRPAILIGRFFEKVLSK